MRKPTLNHRKPVALPALAGALLIVLLSAGTALRAAGAPESAEAKGSSQLRLPCGPEGPGRFGAYPATLKYDPAWDKPWPVSEAADVVVRFDEFDHRFVFWRGTSYVPCWATYNGAWFCNEFFERRGGAASGTSSMVEPMSDKKTRYSHVRIIENTDARVVVHWRYAPVDLDYQQAYVDKKTRWGDWADEFYTIYPDSVGVRKATLYTSALDDWIEYQESIVINQPGTIPEDNLEFAALTLANLKGESRHYTWTENGGPKLSQTPADTCIQVVNTKSKFKPFTIVNPGGASVNSYGGHAPGSQVFRTRPQKYEWSPDAYLAFPFRGAVGDMAISRDGLNWKYCADLGLGNYLDQVRTTEGQAMKVENGGDQAGIANGMIRHGDKIWQYIGGRSVSKKPQTFRVTQRLDGFLSLDAREQGGVVITRPLVFEGRKLVLNVAAKGQVKVAILNTAGREIGGYGIADTNPSDKSATGFGLRDCDPIKTDSVSQVVTWKGNSDVSKLAGQIVRLRFEMQDAKLFAFQFE